mmetsp:Transcript_49984/g.109246  ORF Transcript_49984/g.109246 Transcript_49984/m.109246 type:complete len:359 (-) Transcript_49984:747-1823(-)
MLDVLLDGHQDCQNTIGLPLRTPVRPFEGCGRGGWCLATRCLLAFGLDQSRRLGQRLHACLQDTVGLLYKRFRCFIIELRCGKLCSLSFALGSRVSLGFLGFGNLRLSVLNLLLQARVLRLQLLNPRIVLVDSLGSFLGSNCVCLALLVTIMLVFQVIILLLTQIDNHIIDLLDHFGEAFALCHERGKCIQSQAAGVGHAQRASSKSQLLPRHCNRGLLHETLRIEGLLECVPCVVGPQDGHSFMDSRDFLFSRRRPSVKFGSLGSTRRPGLAHEALIVRSSSPQIGCLVLGILLGLRTRGPLLGGGVLRIHSSGQLRVPRRSQVGVISDCLGLRIPERRKVVLKIGLHVRQNLANLL